MQYVTKFINVIGSYYGEIGINAANSTGATDIIVVEQLNGTFLSTPFHVRFGKLNILRPKEVIVDLYLNNEYVKEIEMRVEPTGEAYFELQDEDCRFNKPPMDDIVFKIEESESLNENLPTFSQYLANEEMTLTNILKTSNESEITIIPRNENTSITDNNDPGYRSCDELEYPMYKKCDFIGEPKLSLCGSLKDMNPMSTESMDRFLMHQVTFDEFAKIPAEILNNQNLVILINNTFLDWKTFSFIMIARLAYNERIPEDSASDILQSKKVSARSYRNWIPWGYANVPISPDSSSSQTNDSLLVSEDLTVPHNSRMRTLSGDVCYSDQNGQYKINDPVDQHGTINNSFDSAPTQNRPSRSVDDSAVHFTRNGMKRTNILPSEKLKLLKLNEGLNELVYVITGKYRGTIKVGCKIYLWHWSDRVVISDIDGTITKSDVWGQLAPWLGLDWTQSGIVKLYNSIQKNHFRFVYLSARAIGQADQTRQYLENVNQQNMFLPDGPLLLAPSSLFIAFRKEVIEKVPEEFKIKCLEELKSLFPLSENPNCLYAGFGNKPSDEITYGTVGIPGSKIFTVNKRGEVCNKALLFSTSDLTSTYDTLYQLVDHYFPAKDTELLFSNEFSSLAFWGQ